MKREVLVALANEFPFGKNEAYMESEVNYWNVFDEVYLLALQLGKESIKVRRDIPKNIKVIPIRLNIPAYLLYSFRTILDKNLYSELKMLLKNKNLNIRTIAQVFLYMSRAHYEADFAYKKLVHNIAKNSEVILYSYRFGYQPYMALLLKEKLSIKGKVYSRAHRYDLYENRKKSGYIPMRNYLLKNITMCFPCSEDGTKYLRQCYPQFCESIETRYLGTEDYGVNILPRSDTFNLVSCSNISEVKRVHLIIEALSFIKDKNILWTHFGAGPLEETIKNQAATKLSGNIKVDWRGSVSNKEILTEYGKGGFNLFINVSSSEGLPVSIMESSSAGIPCIATNVGGTGEILENKVNGFLIDENTDSKTIANLILEFINMSDEEYNTYCSNARKVWETKFSAAKNYNLFANELIGQ